MTHIILDHFPTTVEDFNTLLTNNRIVSTEVINNAEEFNYITINNVEHALYLFHGPYPSIYHNFIPQQAETFKKLTCRLW